MTDSDKEEAFLDYLGQYHPDGEVPEGLKGEVFFTMDFIELSAEVLEIFIDKFIDTNLYFLDDFE